MDFAAAQWRLPQPISEPGWPALHSDPLIAEVLFRRGFREAGSVADFLDAAPRPVPDGSTLPRFREAVDRARAAIQRGERIAIFGDYDADGVTATAILTTFLRAVAEGPHLIAEWLPTRQEGYGLTEHAVEHIALGHEPSLLIAVDCGSRDHPAAAAALARGIDVIILDHHQIPDAEDPPPGTLTVSAYCREYTIPATDNLRDLTGAGLALVFVTALGEAMTTARSERTVDPRAVAAGLMDLAAIGTVGDVASLQGVNRALVRDGIRAIRKTARPGVNALCEVAGVDKLTLTAEQIAMRLVPRLNAAGRMDNPKIAFDLLMATNTGETSQLARRLEWINNERKRETDRVLAEAERDLNADSAARDRAVIVASGDTWPEGVAGIIAARLAERWGRPAVVLRRENGTLKGSARSVPGFDIAKALQHPSLAPLIERTGGHSQAAGLTLPTTHLARFVTTLDAVTRTDLVTPIPHNLVLDAELPTERLGLETARALGHLAPFGTGNETPLLFIRGARVKRSTIVGRDPSRQHLKVHVRGGQDNRFDIGVMAWGMAHRAPEAHPGATIDLAVTLGVDRWNGQVQLQVIAKDFRATS